MLRNWILGLTAGSILCAAAEALSPNAAVSRVLKLTCGAVLLSLLLSPLLSPDWETYALSMAEYHRKNMELSREIELRQDYLSRVYIEQECAAYILDEAEKLGLAGRAEVRAAWRDELWVPQEVMLHIKADTQQRAALSQRISAELGIPAERQVWYDGG